MGHFLKSLVIYVETAKDKGLIINIAQIRKKTFFFCAKFIVV